MPQSSGAHRIVIAAVLAACTLGAAFPAATPEPELQELEETVVTGKADWPLRDYVSFPRYDSVVISPDGRHVATGWSEDSYARRIAIMDFPSLKPAGSRTLQTHFGVADLHWLDNTRLLIQPDWPLRGLRRLRQPVGTLLVRDLDGNTLRELNPVSIRTIDAFAWLRGMEKSTRPQKGPDSRGPVRAVATRVGEENQLLFHTWWTGKAGSKSSDVYGIFRLDLATGKQQRVALLPIRDGRVITGPGQAATLVIGRNAADQQLVYYLPETARAEGKAWKVVARSGSGERGLLPVAWTGEGEEYFALDGRDPPTRAVVIWNPRDNTQRPLYRHPEADMDAVSLDPSGRPWMFSGVHHYPVYWYPAPAHPLAQLHRLLVQRLDDDHIDIVSATDDLSTAVVRVSSGRRPTIFLLVDVQAAKSLTGMDSFPQLRGRRLSPVRAIDFVARDGLRIRGYLTTPLDEDSEPRRGLPLLVMSHEGPGDAPIDFSYEIQRQLFASRGYAVLQVNARGTSGRGVAFEQAGDGRWGREVQDDFADAVRWAVKDGVAADGKACFYGTGYGAYSGMMAAARNPGIFQCIIGVSGVYDLPSMAAEWEPDEEPSFDEQFNAAMKRSAPDRAARARNRQSQGPTDARAAAEDLAMDGMQALQSVLNGEPGEAEEDMDEAPIKEARVDASKIPPLLKHAFGDSVEELRSRSPIHHASEIKAKVMLIHQHLYEFVPHAQTRAMAGALRSTGNRPKVQTIGADTQGYLEPGSRTYAYQQMIDFLDDHIGD